MTEATGTDAHRERILRAALDLLSNEGQDAVTTRSVAEAAQVQPTVLYRIFGDKAGLLDALAAYGFAAYLSRKRLPTTSDDPVEDLRRGWALHVEFGLENPALYRLMYASSQPKDQSAARQASEMLSAHMQRVAIAGRLRLGVAKACAFYHASAVGVVMSLLGTSPEQRDLSLSSLVRDHALRSMTTHAPESIATETFTRLIPASVTGTTVTVTSALHALVTEAGETMPGFTRAERLLLLEWLKRLSEQEPSMDGMG